MDAFDIPTYVAILRTRDAELKGFRNLDPATRGRLLPVMEFTRSRRGKNNLEGSVSLCVSQVQEILGDEYFIADVSTLTALASSETQSLLDPNRNFQNWRRFVRGLGNTCIPVIHLTEPFDAGIARAQAISLIENSGMVAVRIPPGYAHSQPLEAVLTEALGSMKKVIVICDGGFVRRETYSETAVAAFNTLAWFGTRPLYSVVASSCFPASVVLPNYGGDAYGKFPLFEVAMSEWMKQQAPTRHVLHGDYALIYPEDVNSMVTRWVPRVDVPLNDEVFYYRYRRDDGGYELAALRALQDPYYKALDCWGHHNILEASQGRPLGRSPAHWISVRVNFHLARQLARLS